MHALEFLKQDPSPIPPVVVISGSQAHLQQEALARLRTLVIADEETSLTRFAGQEVDLQTVTDELRTVSMWGDRRLVVVENADEFISDHRAALEKYVEHPAKKSVLALQVKTWPKTTRLAKQLAQVGLDIECTELKGPALSKWLQDTARDAFRVALQRDAAAMLVELVGSDLGLLNQELAKLAAYVGGKKSVTADDVRGLVGDWQTETTWAMTDATRDGRLPEALLALNQLLNAGEAPLKLLGGISFVFRKLAMATELSRGQPLDKALEAAGVFARDVSASMTYLRRIGRPRAERLLDALVTAEQGLKGGSRLPERIQMERLLTRLSGAA